MTGYGAAPIDDAPRRRGLGLVLAVVLATAAFTLLERAPRAINSSGGSGALLDRGQRGFKGEDAKASAGEDEKASTGEDEKASSAGEEVKAPKGLHAKASAGEDAKASDYPRAIVHIAEGPGGFGWTDTCDNGLRAKPDECCWGHQCGDAEKGCGGTCSIKPLPDGDDCKGSDYFWECKGWHCPDGHNVCTDGKKGALCSSDGMEDCIAIHSGQHVCRHNNDCTNGGCDKRCQDGNGGASCGVSADCNSGVCRQSVSWPNFNQCWDGHYGNSCGQDGDCENGLRCCDMGKCGIFVDGIPCWVDKKGQCCLKAKDD